MVEAPEITVTVERTSQGRIILVQEGDSIEAFTYPQLNADLHRIVVNLYNKDIDGDARKVNIVRKLALITLADCE